MASSCTSSYQLLGLSSQALLASGHPAVWLVAFQAANEVDVGRPLFGVDLQRSPIVTSAHMATRVTVDKGANGSAREERAILLHRQHPETLNPN